MPNKSYGSTTVKNDALQIHSQDSIKGSVEVEDKAHTFGLVNGRPLTDNWKGNLAAGVTVSLVNVPLSIALAVAGGASPLMGLATGIFGGLVGAVAGGSHFNIMGPTGALSGLLSAAALTHGPAILPYLSICSALIVIVVWKLHWDQYATFLPSSTFHGFSLGVAFIIGAGQLRNMFGITGVPLYPNAAENLYITLSNMDKASFTSFVVFLSFWLPLYSLGKVYKMVPWMVVVAVGGCVLGSLCKGGYVSLDLLTIGDKFGELTVEKLWEVMKWTTTPADATTAANLSWKNIFVPSLSIAFVAVLETLISGKIADRLMASKVPMDASRETLGVGLANLASGLVGGVPATAALARTALSIRLGASSRVAGVISSLSTLLLSVLFLPYLDVLPLPVVAAMVFQVAVGMVETHHIARFWKDDTMSFCMTMLVALICFGEDPTSGIVFGTIVGLLYIAKIQSFAHAHITGYSAVMEAEGVSVDWRMIDNQNTFQAELFRLGRGDDEASVRAARAAVLHPTSPVNAETGEYFAIVHDIFVYRLVGKLCYIDAEAHAARLHIFEGSRRQLIVSFYDCNFADIDGVDALAQALQDVERSNGAGDADQNVFVSLASVNMSHGGHIQSMLCKSAYFSDKIRQGLVYPDVRQALAAARTRMLEAAAAAQS